MDPVAGRIRQDREPVTTPDPGNGAMQFRHIGEVTVERSRSHDQGFAQVGERHVVMALVQRGEHAGDETFAGLPLAPAHDARKHLAAARCGSRDMALAAAHARADPVTGPGGCIT